MSSLGTNLLLLHGYIHDPDLVRRLAKTGATQPPDPFGGTHQRIRSPFAVLASLYFHACLGIGDWDHNGNKRN